MERQLPATNLDDAWNECDPAESLPDDDLRWVDLAPGRGDEGSVVAQCRKRIIRSRAPLVQLLAGHRGSGKSTELQRLAGELREAGFFVAIFGIQEDLDLEDTEPPDILLAVIRQLELCLRKANFHLSTSLLEDLESWFGEVVLDAVERTALEAVVKSEIGLGGEVPLFAKLLARFTGQVKTGTESKQHVRRKLEPQVSQLAERTRTLVSAARAKVRSAGHEDLVVIVDGLDRIALKTRSDDLSSHETIFIDRGELLKSFGCHTVIAVPISLVFSSQSANLQATFPDIHVLSMVKINEQGSEEPWIPGRQVLRELLDRRLDIEQLCEPGVAEYLVDQSGGHPRILMQLMRSAIDFTEGDRVSQKAATKACGRLANVYSRSVPEEHWIHLARVHRTRKVKNDQAHQQMLLNLSVLEYQNTERWCDVLPVVQGLTPFQMALESLDAKTSDG